MSKYEKDEKELREFKRNLLVLDVINMFVRTIPATANELVTSRKNGIIVNPVSFQSPQPNQPTNSTNTGLNQDDNNMDFDGEDEPEEVLRGIFEGCDKRVSFTTVMRDPWSVLAVHLNEETVSAFLPLATPLEISSDKMYMLVIQNLVNKVREDLDSLLLHLDLIFIIIVTVARIRKGDVIFSGGFPGREAPQGGLGHHQGTSLQNQGHRFGAVDRQMGGGSVPLLPR